MKKIFLLTIFLFSATFSARAAEQESTPSSDLDSRMLEVREAVEQIVGEKLEQLISEQKKVGWLGIITNKDNSTITLEGNDKERQLLFSDETIIVDLKSQKLKLEELTTGKKIVGLGYQQTENIMEAKKVILVDEIETSKLPLLGTVSDKSQVENLIVITPIYDKDQTLEITLNSKTEIINQDNEKSNYNDLEKGQKIAVVYQAGEEENTALMIRIIESVQKEPLPSPEPTAISH